MAFLKAAWRSRCSIAPRMPGGMGLRSNVTCLSVPVRAFGDLYAVLTGEPVSMPMSKVSSAEKRPGTVFSTRPSPTFLSLTVTTQGCGSRSGQRIARPPQTIDRDTYTNGIEDHAGQLHEQPHIFAVGERRVVKVGHHASTTKYPT